MNFNWKCTIPSNLLTSVALVGPDISTMAFIFSGSGSTPCSADTTYPKNFTRLCLMTHFSLLTISVIPASDRRRNVVRRHSLCSSRIFP